MPIRIPDDRYLVPAEPMTGSQGRPSHGVWSPTGQILNLNHHAGWCIPTNIAARQKQAFPHHADTIDRVVALLQPRLPHHGGYTHSNPDIRRVVTEGFLAMEAELDEQLAVETTDEERNLLLALRDYADGVKAFHRRTVEALDAAVEAARDDRQRRIRLIRDSFARGFMHPAKTFLEGLLAVNFTWMLDACDSIGRFDQVLGPLFEQDRADGTLDLQFARDLLDELWQSFEYFNAWNLQIGGWTPESEDGTNQLTYECLAACKRNRLIRPNVAFRVTGKTPDRAIDAALDVLALGGGRPPLYNDDLYVRTLLDMDLGLTPEDAREIGFGGCTETMIAGLSNCGSLEGYLNLAKALELAMFDGRDQVTGRQAGPHTGHLAEFDCFTSFYQAVKDQIRYMTSAFVAHSREALTKRMTLDDPKLYRTFFTRDCVKRRRSFEAGGARYNWAVVSYHGIANLIDGLAAIRKCVYEDGTVTPTELTEALAANYAGFEQVRAKLLAAPKFGNDDPYVDDFGAGIIEFAWRELYRHETPRGGRYLASCILFATYQGAGQQVGATPDGRYAGEVLVDSVGPMQGRDVNGPTAMLRSVAKLPLSLAVGTPVLNVRLQQQLLKEARGRQAVIALIRGFFAQGGMQIQVSVLDKEAMLDAQREPEKHGDLIVRIGGYSEYFVRLSRELQDSVIARTEHGL